EAAGRDPVRHHLPDRGDRPLPDRPGDHAGLAEPAAVRAAAEDLDAVPLVHGLRDRHHWRLRIRPLIQVKYRVFRYRRRHARAIRYHVSNTAVSMIRYVVEAGYISDRRQSYEQPVPPAGLPLLLPATDQVRDRQHGLLPVAEYDRVQEVRHRFWVERRVPTSDYQRVRPSSFC